MEESQFRQITQKGRRRREFVVGENVMTRDYRDVNKKHWVEAKIEKKIENNVYLCRLPTQHLWKRHSNQIARKQSTSKIFVVTLIVTLIVFQAKTDRLTL